MIRIELKRVLKKRKRSVYWLANTVKASYPSIWKLAEGDVVLVNLDLLARICEALQCDVDEILVLRRKRK